jgi:serine/threonine protein kinase
MSPVAERNLQRLEKVVAVDQDSRGSAESFHLREATKPLLTPQEGRKMVVLANQRLRKGDLEELFGVTLADKPVPSIPVMRHSSLKLDSLLGHGQFHAVYDLKDEHGHGGHHSHGPHSNFRHNTYNRQEKVVVKTLRPKLQRNMTTARQLSTGAADLVKEALLLQTLKAHPHIIDLKGWSGDGLSGFSSGNHDGFFMVLQELTTTLKDKLVVGGDWRDEALFLHERLGHDYAYGYYHHHIPKAVETPKDDHKKKRGFFASLFGSPGNHHRDGEDPNLHYRSPQAQKALLDKQHAFFCTRLAKCIEMADALAYMHDLRILHRDLKRE